MILCATVICKSQVASSQRPEFMTGISDRCADSIQGISSINQTQKELLNMLHDAANYLVTVSIKNAQIRTALEAAKLANRSLTAEEVVKLIDACVLKGWFNDALEAAKLAGRSLTNEEINKLVNACVIDARASTALEAAKLANRSLTAEEVVKLIDAFVSKGQFNDALEGVKLLEPIGLD